MTTRSPGESTRTRIDLDGTWEFVTDPVETGLDGGWHQPNARWPDRTRTVTIPHAWQELDDHREYTGVAWYRRHVSVPDGELDGRDALLRFGAVDYETTVWLNGRQVGTNRGGYLPFELDATDALEPGENALVVRVEDPADLAEIPHGKQGDPWYTRVSGIWGSVTLAFRPRTRIVDARVTPDLSADTATVELDVVGGPTAADDPTTESPGHQKRRDSSGSTDRTCTIRARTDGEVVASAELDAGDRPVAVLSFDDPSYWSPSDPVLYDLEVILREDGQLRDRYTDTFGLRSIATDGDQFLLNGEPLRMRGVLEQGYYPGTLYRPHDGWSFEREIETASDLGFNLIRKHVKPAHPDFLAAADRLGVLVWEEPANPIRDSERSRREVRDQVRGMVARDYNHPSVVVWSLYNESWGLGHESDEEPIWTDEEKQQFLADEIEALRELDPTRLVCDNSGWAHVATDINDYHRYFASPDRAAAWERDLDHICHYPADNYATTGFDDTDAPVVISECGAWGLGSVRRLRERYGDDPPWFGHDFLEEAYKRPAGVDERFVATGLAGAFDDLNDLAATWQRRQFVAVKQIIQAMRVRERVAGYVLTQLSDVEWEFNGLLEYGRERKSFLPAFDTVNAPLAVVADPDAHVAWDGDSLGFAVHLVNDTDREHSGVLEWELGGHQGAVDASVPANSVETCALPSLPVAADQFADRRELSVAFNASDRSVETTEPVTVVDRDARRASSRTVYAEGAFASRLARAGLTVTHELSTNVDLAFSRRLSGEFDRFAARGGTVVHVPDEDGRMSDDGPFAYRRLPESESWVGVAGLFYQHPPLLADLAAGPELGWEFEDLYPSSVATGLDPDRDRLHVGYVEGWLENHGSPLVVRPYGDGTVAALTFRVPETYGSHPVGTLLCDRLIETLPVHSSDDPDQP